jgi:hypothetical protein
MHINILMFLLLPYDKFAKFVINKPRVFKL